MAVLTTAGKAKIIIGLIASVVSFFLGVYAYAKFSVSTRDFLDVLDNWEMDPIHDIKFVQGSSCTGTDSAGFTYTTIDEQPQYDYTTERCDCSQSSSTITPTPWTQCSRTEIDRNCTTVHETHLVSVPLWKEGYRACVTRVPDANALERIRVGVQESCPSGFHKCNVIDCYPSTVNCPIIEAQVFADDAAARAAGFNETYRVAPSATLLEVYGVRRGDASMDVIRTPLHQFRQSGTAGSNDEGQYHGFDSIPAQTLLAINGHQAVLTERNKWAAQATRTWYQAYRQEVFWKADCPAERKTLVDSRDSVNSISTALAAVMAFSIISFISNLILTYLDYKAKTDDVDDNDNKYDRPKKICGITMECANTIPTLIAMIIAMNVASIFKDVQNGACSVDSVNEDVKALADKIISTASTTMIAKFAIGILYLIYRIIAMIRGEKTVESDNVNRMADTSNFPKPGAESAEMA